MCGGRPKAAAAAAACGGRRPFSHPFAYPNIELNKAPPKTIRKLGNRIQWNGLEVLYDSSAFSRKRSNSDESSKKI